MVDVKVHTHVFVPQLTEPKIFIPFGYAGKFSIDPFNANKLVVGLAKIQADGNGLKPNLKRRREVLENYPLDTFRMVGSHKNSV